MIFLPLMILVWLLFVIIRVVVAILGAVIIPVAVLFGAYDVRTSPFYERDLTLFTWPIMAPFQNYEDGIDAGLELPNAPKWLRIIVWSAFRNPTNGFRWTPIVGSKYNQSKLKYVTYPKISDTYRALWDLEEGVSHDQFFYLCYQGIYGNMKFQFVFFGYKVSFWWGNSKLYPSGKFIIPHYQRYGVGPVGPSIKIKKL